MAAQVEDARKATESAVAAAREIAQTISKLAMVGAEISAAVCKQANSTQEIMLSVERVVVESERVGLELGTLDQTWSTIGGQLQTLGSVAGEASKQGELIQRKSAQFLLELNAA